MFCLDFCVNRTQNACCQDDQLHHHTSFHTVLYTSNSYVSKYQLLSLKCSLALKTPTRCNKTLNNILAFRTCVLINNCDSKICFEVKDLFVSNEEKMYLDMGTVLNINHWPVSIIQGTF
jgi:hypothetical protein